MNKKPSRRSKKKIWLLLIPTFLLAIVLIFVFGFRFGGDLGSEESELPGVADDSRGRTVQYAYLSVNRSKTSVNGDILTLSNRVLNSELELSDLYSAITYGSESGEALLLSLPMPVAISEDREYRLALRDCNDPLDEPYSAEAELQSVFVASGMEKEFVSLKRYSFTEKSDISSWSLILSKCKLSLDDDIVKISLSSDGAYFGNGKISVPMTEAVSEGDPFIRVRIKGKGVSGLEASYSAKFENQRLQGSSFVSCELSEEWTDLYFPMDKGTFIGEVYSLYFRMKGEDTAEIYIKSIEIGTISEKTAPVECKTDIAVTDEKLSFASRLSFSDDFPLDALYSEAVLSSKRLLKIELHQNGESSFFPVKTFSYDGIDYAAFYYEDGETILLFPTCENVISADFILTADGRFTVRAYHNLTDSRNPSSLDRLLGWRILYAGRGDVQDFESILKEEREPLTENRVSLAGGQFEGYFPEIDRYRFSFNDPSVPMTVTINPIDNRTIHLEIVNGEGDLSVYDGKGSRLPIVLGDEENVLSLSLKAGSPITLSFRCGEKSFLASELTEGISYQNSTGREVGVRFTSARYSCLGDWYSEIVYTGTTDDGAASVSFTIVAYSDGEIPIQAVDLDIQFLRDTQINNLSENLHLLRLGTSLSTACYTDVSGGFTTTEISSLHADNRVFTLGIGSPCVAAITSDETEIGGIVVTSFDITSGVRSLPSSLHLCFEEEDLYLTTNGDLTAGDTCSFGLGDRIRLNAILSRTSAGEDLETYATQLRKEFMSGFVLTTDRGSILQTFPVPSISLASDGTTSFSLYGGSRLLPAKIEGFRDFVFPFITVDGKEYVPDWYDVCFGESGSYAFVFPVPSGSRITVN